jgi:GTPase SAR1 family protein
MYWHSLYNNRFSWAERAYETFLSELDPELSKAFKREKEISIVLFGPTQVGKTTLLLTLMGVSPAHFDQVATVLRGKQKKGCSATAMPTYYEISSDDHWYITDAMDTGLSDKSMATALSDLRAKVEAGHVNHEEIEPYRIFIPRCYFNNISNDFRTKVLDLPGIMAANDHERKLVTTISQKYVPTADLVLMVARADYMGFLHPENITIPEVADWIFTPNRFRLIFTHTFSSASFRDEFLNNLDSVDDVSSYFLEQLKTHIPGLDVNKEQIYPLEYGLSYDGMKNGDNEYFEKVERITLGLFDRLRTDITKSGTKENRIRAALDVHVVAERKKKEFITSKEACRSKLEKDLFVFSEKSKVLGVEIKAEKKLGKRLKPDMDDGCYEKALIITQQVLKRDEDLCVQGESTDSVRGFISNSRSDFKKKCISLMSMLVEIDVYVDINSTYKGFEKLERSLDDYLFSTYFPSVSDDLKNDSKLAYTAEKKMFNSAVKKTNKKISILYDESLAKYNKDILYIKNSIVSMERAKAASDKKIRNINSKIVSIDNSIRDFVKRMADSSLKSLRFKTYLEREYASECVVIKELVSGDDGINKFYSLCYAKLVTVLYSNLMGVKSAKQQ